MALQPSNENLVEERTVSQPDWETIWQVERDICYLYHEQAEYTGINGDLAYGTLYNLPYWEFLNLHLASLSEERARFIRDGCLVMLLAMAWDLIDGSGNYLAPWLEPCRQAVTQIVAPDAQTERLVAAVLLAFILAESGEHANDALIFLSQWVNRTYVRGYFYQRIAPP